MSTNFLQSSDSRQTSQEILNAIFSIANKNGERAVKIGVSI